MVLGVVRLTLSSIAALCLVPLQVGAGGEVNAVIHQVNQDGGTSLFSPSPLESHPRLRVDLLFRISFWLSWTVHVRGLSLRARGRLGGHDRLKERSV